jgi:hypothetical protein
MQSFLFRNGQSAMPSQPLGSPYRAGNIVLGAQRAWPLTGRKKTSLHAVQMNSVEGVIDCHHKHKQAIFKPLLWHSAILLD